MLLIDIIIAAGAFAVIAVGTFGIVTLRRKAKPEIKGAENAEDAKAQSRRRCHFCRKDTDVKIDVFDPITNHWYHRTCFLNAADKEKAK